VPIISLIQDTPLLFVVLMGLLGLITGSFLNVVIYRLPLMMQREWRSQCRSLLELENPESTQETFNLVKPRSRCPQCQHLITAIDNIPVLSYLLLVGKCRYCKTRISLQYPLIEILSCVLTAAVAWHFGFTLETLFAAVLTWSLISLSVIDLDQQLLPDDITLPMLWLGLICNMFGLFTDIHSSLAGAILGYGILWLIFMSYKLLTGKEGMGYGDFKLLAMLGAWLGWEMLPLIILLSSLVGAIFGIGLILFARHERAKPIPFGPYLAMAGWIALIAGDRLIGLYLGWAMGT